MLFSTLREPPRPGSLRESLLILYVLKKEQIEHARLRTLAQALVDKEKAVEVFQEYQKTAFPWIATQKRRDKEEHIRLLLEEVKRGVLGIRPLWEQPRSKLKERVKASSAPPTKGSEQKQNEIYKKIGMVVPIK